MFRYTLFFAGLIFSMAISPCNSQTEDNEIKTPESFFGFKPGADRELINYQPMIDYLKMIAEKSDRADIREIGTTPMGKTMYAVFLSSPENISKLERLREVNKSLALDPGLSEEQQAKLIEEGKVFVMGSLSMHSTEVAPSQAAPLIAWELATTNDPEMLGWLDNVVYLMIPSGNPDGMDMVVEHYRKYRGTKYEGSSMPGVYHKYVGHDNNRDFVTLSQSDNAAVAKIYNQSWFPQVLVDKHQMGSTGPRYFVPPMHDPIAENVDEQIWTWSRIFGSNMAGDMAAKGQAGVSQQYMFDDYWPGSTETAIWKNVIAMLTEAASCKYATPVYVEKNELRVGGKGLGEYKKSINMPLPWEGGWWRLGDIVSYELSSTYSILKTASRHKGELLKFRNDICKKEVEKGKNIPPYYYVLHKDQNDPGELTGILNLMNEHGVEAYKTEREIIIGTKVISSGDFVFPLAQPFRSFIKEVMEKQKFPERHYTPGGEMIRPYDITSWSLPLHRGIDYIEINEKSPEIEKSLVKLSFPLDKPGEIPGSAKTIIFPVSRNESFKAVFQAMYSKIDVHRLGLDEEFPEGLNEGDFLVQVTDKNREQLNSIVKDLNVPPIYADEDFPEELKKISIPKIALVETNFHDMDAGWTRYIFDTYSIPFTVLKPEEIKDGKLDDYDVIIFPDNSKDILLSGKSKRSDDSYSVPFYDPKFVKGMGKEGLGKLMKYLDEGGVILSWGSSTGLFMGTQSIETGKDEKEEFSLPVNDLTSSLKSKKLSIPGSLVRINLLQHNPLTLGLPESIGVFSDGGPVFSTSIPDFDMDRRVIATYPEEDILMSGFAENEDALAGKTAMVWLKKGKGQIVMYGFNPQFRASTQVSYKLLFNGLFLKP
jgi:hypothetical protein